MQGGNRLCATATWQTPDRRSDSRTAPSELETAGNAQPSSTQALRVGNRERDRKDEDDERAVLVLIVLQTPPLRYGLQLLRSYWSQRQTLESKKGMGTDWRDGNGTCNPKWHQNLTDPSSPTQLHGNGNGNAEASWIQWLQNLNPRRLTGSMFFGSSGIGFDSTTK
ncbi:hypothetical protein SAY87_019890 [Trapa incisa]|uniref:Uncharacterized protein n=1 Tax=Trapa incisa TaxID=236973 RepID=A0AAN7K2Z7_9MYRT|nr:hypothetical protein SAY87_019890 [Trapa incisa]